MPIIRGILSYPQIRDKKAQNDGAKSLWSCDCGVSMINVRANLTGKCRHIPHSMSISNFNHRISCLPLTNFVTFNFTKYLSIIHIFTNSLSQFQTSRAKNIFHLNFPLKFFFHLSFALKNFFHFHITTLLQIKNF